MNNVIIERHRSGDDLTTALRQDVREGLSASQKWLPATWFYDARGSELFEEITALPEYYPTRAEREVLLREAPAVAAATGARTLVELGAGSSEKTRALLDALRSAGTLTGFVPQDVSASALTEAAEAIAADYPDLAVHGVVGDFTANLGELPGTSPRLVAFLGGTIGNFPPAERAAFLRSVRAVLKPGEWLLLGTDLVKDPATLVAAYDDARGVTAEFNRNVLTVLNARLGADADPADFDHVAVWDAEHEWIEMRLRARRDLVVHVPGAGLDVEFRAGEHLRTEVSAKFRPEVVRSELADAGFTREHWWTDEANRFGVSLSRAV
ncbi:MULTISPECIES: L-histidine N(alpha)-methyltransferase [Prauserella salsuginis group]|uniref:Histidine N-alpha-methyltransferase n=2 Tax=Prauserella salsuginis group TaxID=2893672 RepID=A0A839XQ10_9PSEU|nr:MULTISPECIES: L-histidine N(alpha)-methyltransferase [Prauserella salsuginis group]MBB3664787.1 L-histidine N-alpha-methyltransferase [Prauserella sediminis]MCR3718256.1 L-histidine Nalpha-methyltransferase [Prauserella flava]MCR3732826.1 L-histidine Nalpha-methyltransferase [Prauserella salsuginis]